MDGQKRTFGARFACTLCYCDLPPFGNDIPTHEPGSNEDEMGAVNGILRNNAAMNHRIEHEGNFSPADLVVTEVTLNGIRINPKRVEINYRKELERWVRY